jgi:hypothetical protein
LQAFSDIYLLQDLSCDGELVQHGLSIA